MASACQANEEQKCMRLVEKKIVLFRGAPTLLCCFFVSFSHKVGLIRPYKLVCVIQEKKRKKKGSKAVGVSRDLNINNAQLILRLKKCAANTLQKPKSKIHFLRVS